MSDTAIVAVRGVSHRYGSRRALTEVSFEVREGEIFALLGPNGGGKSTLFKILSTLMKATGEAEVCGIPVGARPDEVRRRIGVVFQSPSVDTKLTAAENLLHHGHLHGIRGAELKSRIAGALDKVGLSDRADDLVGRLSGGQQRRVEIAKVMLHEPRLLIMDEPSTGLDPGARHGLWRHLVDLREGAGVTTLLTTHLIEEAERADRCAILDAGRLVALGTPDDLRSEIGGDVVSFSCADPETMAREVGERFGVTPTVLGRSVHVERERGHAFLAELVEAFPGRFLSVTVRRPTLEDVFVHRTGHRLEGDGEEDE